MIKLNYLLFIPHFICISRTFALETIYIRENIVRKNSCIIIFSAIN